MTNLNENQKPLRLSAEDWLDEALRVLAEQGVQAIAVERLAKTLGVTKGSFYWHFKNRKELLKAVLVFWENLEHQYISDYEQTFDEPRILLKEVLYILIKNQTNRRVFLHLAQNSFDDESKACYERATTRRVTLFMEIYRKMGLSEALAKEKALIAYCEYFGLIKLIEDGVEGVLSLELEERLIQLAMKRALEI